MNSLWNPVHLLVAVLVIVGTVALAPAQSFTPNSLDGKVRAKTPSGEAKPRDPALSRASIEKYKSALRSTPNDSILLNNIGVEYALAEQYPAAAIHLERAVITSSGSAPYLINLALVYKQLDRTTEAVALLDRATSLSPGDLRARKALCDILAGHLDYLETANCYETLQTIEELDPISATNLGNALANAGQKERAIKVLEDAADRFRANFWILNALGMIHFKAKDYSIAADLFKRAVEIGPEQAEVRYNLAVTQLAVGNRPGAISQYNLLKSKASELAFELYKQIYSDKVVFVGKR